MLRLAVTTRAETFERMRDPLAERGIRVRFCSTTERATRLDRPHPELADVDVGFVYPSRTMDGGVLDAVAAVPWVNDREAILTSRNKAGVIAALARAGLSVPKTVFVSNPTGEADVVEAVSSLDASFPLVVKPNSSTRGIGVAKAGDLDSLLGIVDYLDLIHDYRATGDKSFLIQEYLPNARDYRAMVVDGVCVGAVERRLPDEAVASGRWKHNVHRGAEAVGVDLPVTHRRLVEETAAALGVRYLGVDLLETDGRLVVNETNARPTIDAETKYEDGFYDRLAALIEAVAAEGG
ncbi:ATP-grasp domain-containing protein [Haloferacaceae archaeon DSL9]